MRRVYETHHPDIGVFLQPSPNCYLMPGTRIMNKNKLPGFFVELCVGLVCMTALMADNGAQASDQVELPYTILDREITQAERTRYEVHKSSGKMAPDVTLSDILEKHEGRQHRWNLKKIVVKRGEGRLIVQTTYLGDDLSRQRNEQEWREGQGRELLVDVGDHGLERTDMDLDWESPTGRIFYPDIDHIRSLTETLKRDQRTGLSAQINVVPGRELTVHEFLREIIRFEFELRETRIGPVLIAKDDDDSWASGEGSLGVAWIARDNVSLLIAARGVSLDTILDLYGEKYPSTLPDNVTYDPVEWGKKEVQKTLKLLKKEINDPTSPRVDANRFYAHISRLQDNVRCPVIPERDEPRGYSKALRKKTYERVKQWWEENKSNVYWDEDIERLAVEGTVPERMKRRR